MDQRDFEQLQKYAQSTERPFRHMWHYGQTGRRVYIVGRILDTETGMWEFRGVFSSAERAEERCTNELDFVVPAIIDESIEDWPEAYYVALVTALTDEEIERIKKQVGEDYKNRTGGRPQ